VSDPDDALSIAASPASQRQIEESDRVIAMATRRLEQLARLLDEWTAELATVRRGLQKGGDLEQR
jgi:hypothetical protein